MPRDPSFEKINYSLRPNKNVERKLIVQFLLDLHRLTTFSSLQYQYVGMGSVWFTDFILMHRALGIQRMISIDRQKDREKRFLFNRPFSNITVKIGTTTEILPTIDLERPTLIWLDYDDVLKDYMFADIDTALEKLQSGSILILTVNGEFSQVENVQNEGGPVEPDSVLRSIAGNSVPANIKDRLNSNRFPLLLGDILHNAMRSKALARKLDFFPFFNFAYKDGAQMVTFGGMVANTDASSAINDAKLGSRYPWLASNGQAKLQLPHLTIKEKLKFDQLLPSRGSSNPPSISELGFELKDEEIKQYCLHYLFYPVFAEWLP